MNETSLAIIGQFVIEGNDLKNPTDLEWTEFLKLPAVYEVVRLMDGVLLFLEDHLERLENSLQLMGVSDTLDRWQLGQSIYRLAAENKNHIGNVKIILALPDAGSQPSMRKARMFFIPHHYPGHEAYAKGYALQTLVVERPEPNAKRVNPLVNQTTTALKSKSGIDEVLLITHEGLVSEGSKSNIFFVRNNQVNTPLRNMVLPGITRQKVIEICKSHTIDLIETKIPVDKIQEMDGAFISGTSPKLMPVQSINNCTFDSGHPLILKIMAEYKRLIEAYIDEHRQ